MYNDDGTWGPAKLFRRVLISLCFVLGTASRAQDGASYNPKAKEYHAPANSLAGAADTPDRMRAMEPLFQANMDEAVPALKQLANSGDIPSALLLAGC